MGKRSNNLETYLISKANPKDFDDALDDCFTKHVNPDGASLYDMKFHTQVNEKGEMLYSVIVII